MPVDGPFAQHQLGRDRPGSWRRWRPAGAPRAHEPRANSPGTADPGRVGTQLGPTSPRGRRLAVRGLGVTERPGRHPRSAAGLRASWYGARSSTHRRRAVRAAVRAASWPALGQSDHRLARSFRARPSLAVPVLSRRGRPSSPAATAARSGVTCRQQDLGRGDQHLRTPRVVVRLGQAAPDHRGRGLNAALQRAGAAPARAAGRSRAGPASAKSASACSNRPCNRSRSPRRYDAQPAAHGSTSAGLTPARSARASAEAPRNRLSSARRTLHSPVKLPSSG